MVTFIFGVVVGIVIAHFKLHTKAIEAIKSAVKSVS